MIFKLPLAVRILQIRAMIAEYPDGLRCRYYGRLPLHLLIEAQGRNTKLSVVLALLQASPISSPSQHFVGKSPLALALEMDVPATVVKALYEADPQAVKTNDHNKK